MQIRYFAAAAAAAGRQEEELGLSTLGLEHPTLADVLVHLAEELHPETPAQPLAPGSTLVRKAPSLAGVLRRSSFLVNQVSEQDHSRVLHDSDVLDVLPPFAGG
ncbi:MoaD/ThiS family protein [Paeniglutamicibacter cryotolerans]|uniref:Molybdopterin converting factor small subunit n=1 Tax=Paeniglutamicibacter cryotolerans TaxID=670079 RepID=A0A839QNG0_9MICC|nr:MoaD/ThiS family protein [Paeniglutamicibacter cryotolerans]MBB2996165.1 molybdopterin converting factor small subunit [Paeniglutamicibacter cryotolerans]